MLVVSLYDISYLQSALGNKKTKQVNVFFKIQGEDLFAFCRLFSFRKFIIKKNEKSYTIFFPTDDPKVKGSDYIITTNNFYK